MPLTEKGKKILKEMQEQYGEEKGRRVFYASINKGTISGAEKKSDEDYARYYQVVSKQAEACGVNIVEELKRATVAYYNDTGKNFWAGLAGEKQAEDIYSDIHTLTLLLGGEKQGDGNNPSMWRQAGQWLGNLMVSLGKRFPGASGRLIDWMARRHMARKSDAYTEDPGAAWGDFSKGTTSDSPLWRRGLQRVGDTMGSAPILGSKWLRDRVASGYGRRRMSTDALPEDPYERHKQYRKHGPDWFRDGSGIGQVHDSVLDHYRPAEPKEGSLLDADEAARFLTAKMGGISPMSILSSTIGSTIAKRRGTDRDKRREEDKEKEQRARDPLRIEMKLDDEASRRFAEKNKDLILEIADAMSKAYY